MIDTVGQLRLMISPRSFFQVNPVQTEVLYNCLRNLADLAGTEVLWDVYCGIGTIGLYLATDAMRVYGIETVPEAIEDDVQ